MIEAIKLHKITELANRIKKQHNLNLTAIKISKSRSKWGSCSSKAVLSFNWRLIFAPIEILEYVIVHEMCHIIQMNHSKKFWVVVENIYPNYKAAKSWLKANHYRLHSY